MVDMNETQDPTRQQPPGSSSGHSSGPRLSGEQMRDVGRLRRSRSDRYIAGVAGGLGRHFDIDPTVIRVLLAVLTFFGGAGLVVYVAVWLLVPEDGEDKAPLDLRTDIQRALLITAAVGAMVLAHVERAKADIADQVTRMKARFRPGSYPGAKAGPGVYANTMSVAAPARLPDGNGSERSISPILPVRELSASEAALKRTEK
jgi:phage shock protein PspC (stress-responsive transcriptional regulator)